MRIVQTTFGVFHHFELARELERRGHLERVYSTWPWLRLQREGVVQAKVETFPWIHVLDMAAARTPLNLNWARDHLGYANAMAFDEWTLRKLQIRRHRGEPRPDALIALSGSALKTGTWLQKQGCVFLCDRGSTHQRFQGEIVAEEYARWGVPYHGTDERDTIREEAIYEQADGITVPSLFAAQTFVNAGIPAEKVHTIPYGVRLEAFGSAKYVTDGPPENLKDEFRVLFAGSVSLRKGVPYLLQAFASLQHPNKLLTVVGQVQHDFKETLAKLPVEHVEFLGSVPQPQLIKLMRSSHVLVLPSIEEGLALVQAQALACGCPVICSTNSGGEDLLTDGVEGFVVPIRDPEAIRDRLERLAGDPELWAVMRAAGLERVQQIGGWGEYGAAWENLLLRLTADKT